MASEKKLYECYTAGFFMGDHYAVGARRRWLPEQVKYDLNQWREVPVPTAAPVVPDTKAKGRGKAKA